MKRKFVKVMFFGALALSTVTYVGCKDYDDDVKGLQEQIDNINNKGADVTTEAMNAAINSAVAGLQSQLDAIASKADKTALDELKKTVSEMQTALGNKADAAKLAELQKKLDEAIAKVDASIETSVAEAKKALQAKIDELEAKLEQADVDAAKQVAKDLADAKKEMQELSRANGDQIKILFEKIDGLEGINAKIEALQEADKKFVSIDQLNEYMNSDAVKDYVEAALVDYLTSAEVTDKVNAVRTYVDGVFRTKMMAEISQKYLSLETYNKDMEDLNEKIKNYVSTEDATYKKIFTDIQTLTDYQDQTIKALVKELADNKTIEQANKVAGALEDIQTLIGNVALCAKTSDLAAYVKSNDLNDAIDTHLTSQFEAYDAEITTIKKRLLALEIDVDGLKSMVQSVTFIPSSADGKVSFYSYYVIPEGKTDKVLVASNNKVVVKFRVSPISAAEKFFENYTATFDGQEFTRTIDIFKGEGKVENKDEGIISFVLSTQTESSHAVCLNVVSKKSVPENAETVDKGTDYFTDINSDYFPVIVTTKTIESLEVVSDNSAVDNIYWNNSSSKIDYKEGYALKAKFVGDAPTVPATVLTSDENPVDLSKFGNPVYDFNEIPAVNEGDDPTIENEDGAYKIEDGVLSLVRYEDASANKKAKVVATVTIKDGDKVLKVFKSTPYKEVKATGYAPKAQDVTDVTVAFNGKADQTSAVTLDYSALGITKAQYEKLPQANFDFKTTTGIRFAFKEGTTKNELVVLIPKGTKEGVNAEVGAVLNVKVFEIQKFTLNLKKVTVTLDKNAYKLTWNENVVTTSSLIAGSVSLMPQFTNDAVGFESNLATLFENYAAIAESAEKVGASIEFSLKNKITGVTIEGNKLKITNAYENTSAEDIVVEAKVIAKSADNKDYALAENTMSATFSLTGVTTTWVWDNTTAKSIIKIGSDNYTESFPLAKGIKWTCGGKTMWENGTASKASATTILLSVLGLEAPVYTITEDDKQYVEIDKTGNLKVKTLGTAIVRNITVTITAESRWGTIVDYANNKTVTVKIDMNKESSAIN